MAKLGDHPGFQAVQQHMASMQNIPMAEAGAELAASTRKASPAAKKRNPRLKRVKGRAKGGGDGSPSYMFNKE
jgi:hypothetical protein